VLGHERRHLPTDLKIRHVAVGIDPVQALDIQGHVSIEKLIYRQLCSHANRMTAADTPSQHAPRRSEAQPDWMSAFRGKAGRVTDLAGENLTGSRFEDVYLTDARFHDVDLTNPRFHLLDMTGEGGMIRGAAQVNADISGEIKNLRVNGVDVVLLVAAELNRRYPDRVKMRPTGSVG